MGERNHEQSEVIKREDLPAYEEAATNVGSNDLYGTVQARVQHEAYQNDVPEGMVRIMVADYREPQTGTSDFYDAVEAAKESKKIV